MNKIKPLLYFFVWLVLPQILFSQTGEDNYKFNRVDVGSGLSNSEVKCVYKDKTGFIWFGTPSGLNRYDGYEITIYKHNLQDNASSYNNDILRIQEAEDGLLWLTTRAGYAIYNPLKEQFEEDLHSIFNKFAGVTSFTNLYIDLGKNYWFITPEDVRLYDVKKKKLIINKQGGAGNLSTGIITDIKQGSNRYWFLFDNGLVECMDAQTHKIIKRDSSMLQKIKMRNLVDMRLFVDSAGDLWMYGIGEHFGLGYYNVQQNKWHVYSETANAPYRITKNIVTSVDEDDKGLIWIGTDHGGINIVNKKSGKITYLSHNEKNQFSITQNTVKCLYRDDTGIMWVGTYKMGVCYYHESVFKFKSVTEKAELPYNDINCFHETSDGNIWIGTNGGGLIYFDRKNERYINYPHRPGDPNSPSGNVIVSLSGDSQGRLWIGYYLEGLDCFDGKKFTHYGFNPNNPDVLTDNNIWDIMNDTSGNLWVGTLRGGVVVIDAATGKRLKHFITDGSVYSIIQKKSGEILIGAQSGLWIYNVAADKLEQYEPGLFNKMQLSKYDINNLYEDSRGLLWIGTRNGLIMFNAYTRDLRTFNVKDGLSADLVQSIQEDADHNLWIGTNSGLSCVKVTTANETPGYFFKIVTYDRSEGLQGEMFNYNAAYITSKQELIFGGSLGFNIFTPNAIIYNSNKPKVVITDFQLYNKSLKPGEKYNGRTILKESITHTQEIELDYSDNYFSIVFAALDYCMPNKSRFYYKLDGFNTQWLEADGIGRKVTYTNLNPGKYTFYLKAVNNDGLESENPIKLLITVRPPFWQTAWAYAFYLLVILSLIYYYIRYSTRKAEKKLAYAREKMRTSQQLELDEIKLRFFTNISHEFRTPLTLILTPLDELLKKKEDSEEKELLLIIRKNAKNLLNLVNQLLDFRKLDVNGHTLQPSVGDIVLFVKDLCNSFDELMQRKSIKLSFSSSIDHLYARFDEDKLSKALLNILSNAHKFTPANGEVKVNMELVELPDNKTEKSIRIRISDSGIGIPTDKLDKIFERFYQIKSADTNSYQGSGIGLHLAKEFINLHGGDIEVESEMGKGSCFTVTIPYKEGDVSEQISVKGNDDMLENETLTEEKDEQLQSLPKILLVEDNDDFRDFVAERLRHHYVVLKASDGMEGMAIALKEIPDIIVSDVMMPKMDGVEMSKALKADIRTSHVPIILLTAKSGEESKLEGLMAGVDDYITKPFNLEILKLKIHNIIEGRKSIQSMFKQHIKIEPSKISVSSLDDKLIKKALDYTEANISNPEFSVEELSRELGMSRVHLYKKLLSITGKTPIEFIRVIRLKRAAQLLEESQLSVSEIAYEVGFNNPKYFRKYFKDEFDVLPSQYGNRKGAVDE